MKTEWQIIESEYPLDAIRKSRFDVSELVRRCDGLPFHARCEITSEPFTDRHYLVVVRWRRR